MKKMIRKNIRGYSLIELLMVMAIMSILGSMLMMLMNIGVKLYRNSNTYMESQSNARLAMSYITMRIRQNDVSNYIDISNVTVNEVDKNNVIIRTTSYPALTIIYPVDPHDSTETRTYWIYFDSLSKKLMEQNVSTGATVTSLSGEEIVDVNDCVIYKKDYLDPITNEILRRIVIKVQPANSTEYLTQELTLRSQQT